MLKLLINSLTKKYFQFKGRANRKEYIVFSVFFLLSVKFLGLFVPYSDFIKPYKFSYFLYISLFYIILLVIPCYSLTIRRLHDLNFSGWWILLINITSFFLALFFLEPFYTSYINHILTLPLFIFKGTSGTNNYGEPPIN